ncbi:MAG: restriction endonuclease [Chitinivibrionia bacterium]|nr:restriction endonuclease [Chitinivibrionia bacterium]
MAKSKSLTRIEPMINTGKNYEEFVAKLYNAILEAGKDENLCLKNIEIKKNEKISDKNGIEREFDLYWEFELGNIKYRNIVECKDYNSPISVEKIDALLGKTNDMQHKYNLIFATKKGYQSGAKIKAEKNGIELLIVREQNDSDWKDIEGNHYIKGVNLCIHGIFPANITNFKPVVDYEWVKENAGLDIEKEPIAVKGLNNSIFIDDVNAKEKYSLLELEQKLAKKHNNVEGQYEETIMFSEAYLLFDDKKLKLKHLELSYYIHKTTTVESIIDFSKELIGVVEFLGKKIKKKIFTNGNVIDDKM